jgi:PRTase ComF-like
VIPRVSLHRIASRPDGLVTLSDEPFDPRRYSRFKYGDEDIAEDYGRRLAAMLSESGLVRRDGPPPAITTAPFKFLPTASYELSLHVRRVLAPRLGEIEIVPLQLRHVDPGNYSARGEVERRQILDEAGLHLGSGEIAGRQVILIDDAVVSGTAETRAVGLLDAAGATDVIGAYVVEVDRESGLLNPEVEDRLNHAFVRDLDALLEIFSSAAAVLNIRTVKYVLNWPDRDDVRRFFQKVDEPQLAAFRDAVLHTGESFGQSYPAGVEVLSEVLRERVVG